jgi:hypothetical protein
MTANELINLLLEIPDNRRERHIVFREDVGTEPGWEFRYTNPTHDNPVALGGIDMGYGIIINVTSKSNFHKKYPSKLVTK